MDSKHVTIICRQCSAPFVLYLCQTVGGRGVFCSKACFWEHRRNGSVRFCDMCDAQFYRRYGEQGTSIKQFCSRECYAQWRAIKRRSYPKDGARHLHRVVAERILARPLATGEVVHHRDNNKQNYDPTNLCVFPSQAEHARCHFGSMSDDELRHFSLTETAHREQRRDQPFGR